MNDNQQSENEQINTASQAASPIEQPNFDKPPKKKSALVISLIIALVIVLLAIGGYLFAQSQNNKQDQANEQKQSEIVEEKAEDASLTPEAVIKKIKDTLALEYTLLDLEKNNKPKSGEVSYSLDARSPVYKVAGYNFYNDYNGGSSLNALIGSDNDGGAVSPSAKDVKARNDVIEIYKEFGLASTGSRGENEYGYGIDIYEGKGLVCTISSPNSAASGFFAECGLLSAYTEAAAQVKLLADVMPNTKSTTRFALLKISKSKTDGYQTAHVGVGDIEGAGGVSAAFYKKGSSPWVYFQSAQDALLCSMYNTEDLKNAFKGEQCYDDDNGLRAL